MRHMADMHSVTLFSAPGKSWHYLGSQCPRLAVAGHGPQLIELHWSQLLIKPHG
jgi:hypothetical protein